MGVFFKHKCCCRTKLHERTANLFHTLHFLHADHFLKPPNPLQLLTATGPRINTCRGQHGDITWHTTSAACQHFTSGFIIRLFLLDICHYSVATPTAMLRKPHSHSTDNLLWKLAATHQGDSAFLRRFIYPNFIHLCSASWI